MIKKLLSKNNFIKKVVKNIYEFTGNIFSNRKSTTDNLEKISDENQERLFGYYDKSPWNADMDKFLYIETMGLSKKAFLSNDSKIIVKKLNDNTVEIVDTINVCNSQQGSMLQWLGPKFTDEIIYNDVNDGKLISKITNVKTGSQINLSLPIYTVSPIGDKAATLNFEKLHKLREGYGYNVPTNWDESIAIKILSLTNNKLEDEILYENIVNLSNFKLEDNQKHKVNHIMFSPSGEKIMFIYRILGKNLKYDQLFVYNLKKKTLSNVLDTGMVSHCNWINDDEIVSYAKHKTEGNNLLKIIVDSKESSVLTRYFNNKDGHPSVSPNGKYIIMDSYPNFFRKQKLYLIEYNNPNNIREIASLFSNYKYRGVNRCDLHPRWSPDSNKICVDASFEKFRDVYLIDLESFYDK